MSLSSTTDPFSMVPTSEKWITEVPSQWDMRRLKTLFRERSVKGYPDLPLLAATQTKGVVTKETYGLRTVIAQSGLENLKLVEPGDFVISLRSFEGGIEVSHARGIISPAYTVLRIKDQSLHGYFVRLFKSRYFLDAIRLSVTGIREGQNVDYARLGRSLVTVPTPASCRAIVRYLDHAELRIAKAIAAKQGLMNRLLELRHVQIAEGILGTDGTRSLNSSLPYNVPGSWRIEPFWTVAPEVSISGQQGKELLSVYLNRGVIRYSESAGQVHKPSLDLSGYQLVRPGDLVLNNQQAWRGSVGVSRYEGIVSPAYVVCSLGDRFDLEYANMLFRSPAMVSQFEMASRGVGSIQRQLHRQTLRVVKVPIPPMEEQVQIAKRLVAATKGLDLAVQSLETEIALLKEYRTRLISDVVTGKLDVRDEAAKLPDIDPMELATVAVGENGDDEEATDDD